ncbi:ATP phosphoribosyltransferase regulatory subunit [Mycoplasma sp. ATU-Cv-508]|uniref:ATP phosphoribosyltransferase regulatory subunit n=1 Tax=Mycoplasma sp. ATU-Cv-508 TaxID=2048001 RepID=UPI000FDD6EED
MFASRPRGTRDFYGPEQLVKKTVEQRLAQLAEQHGFSQIETPIFEHAQVFTKSIGLGTDIVGKEMYQFNDRKNRPMVLRPEATASVVRAWVEEKLHLKSDYHRLYYSGPMFRYENPQRGRYRQFHQFGVEYLSPKDPCADLEIILLAQAIVKRFGLKTKLVINSLGDAKSRQNYVKTLRAYFQKKSSQFKRAFTTKDWP